MYFKSFFQISVKVHELTSWFLFLYSPFCLPFLLSFLFSILAHSTLIILGQVVEIKVRQSILSRSHHLCFELLWNLRFSGQEPDHGHAVLFTRVNDWVRFVVGVNDQVVGLLIILPEEEIDEAVTVWILFMTLSFAADSGAILIPVRPSGVIDFEFTIVPKVRVECSGAFCIVWLEGLVHGVVDLIPSAHVSLSLEITDDSWNIVANDGHIWLAAAEKKFPAIKEARYDWLDHLICFI